MTTRSKTVRTLGFAFALLTSIVSMSSASYAYTSEQAQMCTGDAFKFCSSEIPNIDKITVCMQQHKAQLSPGCRALMPAK
jgi:hypothetical protein